MDAGPVWAWREFPCARRPRRASTAAKSPKRRWRACSKPGAPRGGRNKAPTPPTKAGPSAAKNAAKRERRIDSKRCAVEEAFTYRPARRRVPGARATCSARMAHLTISRRPRLAGPAGEPSRGPTRRSLSRSLVDSAVWIGHAKRPGAREIKLPAARPWLAHGRAAVQTKPVADSFRRSGWRRLFELRFLQRRLFDRAMRGAIGGDRRALRRPTRVLVLIGGADCWSNGLHLGVIEASRIRGRRVVARTSTR